jgi:hypothetical protein
MGSTRHLRVALASIPNIPARLTAPIKRPPCACFKPVIRRHLFL